MWLDMAINTKKIMLYSDWPEKWSYLC